MKLKQKLGSIPLPSFCYILRKLRVRNIPQGTENDS